MKRIMVLFVSVTSVIILIFLASFYFIDKEKHKVFYYSYFKDGNLVGNIKFERFVTEDKIIYISEKDLEYESYPKKIYSKLTLDKNSREFTDYHEKETILGVSNQIYLQNKKNKLSYLNFSDSEFTYLDNISFDKNMVFFKKENIATFPELLKKCGFEKGKKIEIGYINLFSKVFPPTISSSKIFFLKHEIMKYNNSFIKTNHIIIESNGEEIASVWTYGWSNSIFCIELPKEKIKIILTSSVKPLEFLPFKPDQEIGYESKEFSVTSNKANLSGTLTLPSNADKVPAVVLICDRGIMDRDAYGLFLSLSDRLSKEGIAVLKFDKRGIGKSEGDYESSSLEDSIGDLKSILNYLESIDSVDKTKIGLVGWGYGGYLGLKFASSDERVKFFISLNSEAFNRTSDAYLEKIQNYLKNIPGLEKDYFNLILESYKKTFAIARMEKDWTYLLGKKIYIARTKEYLDDNFNGDLKNLKIPLLLLQGKLDTQVLPEEAKMLQNNIKESGNAACELIYMDNLDHFMGEKISDGVHRPYVLIKEDVVKIIKEWLNKIFEKNSPPPV